MKKDNYILVNWPESQLLMDHPRFEECSLADCDDFGGSAYFVPEELFDEIFNI